MGFEPPRHFSEYATDYRYTINFLFGCDTILVNPEGFKTSKPSLNSGSKIKLRLFKFIRKLIRDRHIIEIFFFFFNFSTLHLLLS